MIKRHPHNTIELNLVEGDTLPTLYGELLEDDETTPINITDWTITLHIKYRSSPLIKTATKYDSVNGKFKFTWGANDIKPGQYYGEIQFVSPEGTQTANMDEESNLLLFNISRQIA